MRRPAEDLDTGMFRRDDGRLWYWNGVRWIGPADSVDALRQMAYEDQRHVAA